MPTVFTRKNHGFSRLYDRKLTQSYTTSQDGLTCPDKFHSQSHRVDRCLPNNLAKLFSRRSPCGSFETKPCMLVNMAHELQKHFPILSPFYNSSGPYLFHSVGMQNHFPHYGQPAVLQYQIPMPHATPSTSSAVLTYTAYSNESESSTKEENTKPGATNRNRGFNWTFLKVARICNLNLSSY